jgi:2-C-methyl-D-erythritol 4-phosphate cytidylyltransferase
VASPQQDSTVVLELHPSSVPAAELPLVLVHDVARVLRAHGLDPDLLSLSSALYGVIQATPVEGGGLRCSQLEAADEREGVRRG